MEENYAIRGQGSVSFGGSSEKRCGGDFQNSILFKFLIWAHVINTRRCFFENSLSCTCGIHALCGMRKRREGKEEAEEAAADTCKDVGMCESRKVFTLLRR